METEHWYYLHSETKDLIHKRFEPEVDITFVVKAWKMDLKDRATAWKLVLEALSMGANVARVKELAEKWNLTKHDAYRMMARVVPNTAMKQGLEIFVDKIFGMSIEKFIDDYKREIFEEADLKVYEMPKQHCPHCGYFTDKASETPLYSRSAPRPGDVTLCLGCGELCRFDENLYMRRLTEDEQREVSNDPRCQSIKEAFASIKQKMGGNEN